jgi:hypothetical protein
MYAQNLALVKTNISAKSLRRVSRALVVRWRAVRRRTIRRRAIRSLLLLSVRWRCRRRSWVTALLLLAILLRLSVLLLLWSRRLVATARRIRWGRLHALRSVRLERCRVWW